MRFSVLGVSLALAWFILVNLAVSIAAGAVARAVIEPGRRDPSMGRSAWPWLLLRVSPSLAALCFVMLVYAPAYARFEPREVTEPLGAGLAAMVVGALIVIGLALWRGVTAWRRVRRLQRQWLLGAEMVSSPGAPIPVYQIDAPAPIVCLVGVCRQRLFIARRVAESLTPAELDVVIAHELAHRSAWDNLSRLAMLASPDLLSLTWIGSAIEGVWARAAEDAADDRATSGDRSRALNLSAALLKVARLSLASPAMAGPVSSLDDGGSIAERIRSLASPGAHARRYVNPRHVLLGVGAALTVACLALPEPALMSVHRVSEFLVRLAA